MPSERIRSGLLPLSVLLASSCVNVLIKGTMKSFGLILVAIAASTVKSNSPVKEEVVLGPQLALVPAIAYTVFACATPLASYLCHLLSCWKVALLGGILATSGVALSAYTTNAFLLCLSLGLSFGFGSCLSTVPGTLLINSAFEKRRGLAHGISLAGNTLGGILIPLLFGFVSMYCTLSGTLLVLSAFVLLVLAAPGFYAALESDDQNEVHASGSSHISWDMSLFRDPHYLLLCLSQALNAIGYTNVGTFAPLHMVTALDADPITTSVALSLFSVTDMLGRILGPGVSDLCVQRVPRYVVYTVAMVGSGASLIGLSVLPYAASLWTFLALFAVTGFFSGVFVGVWNPLLSDCFGPVRFRVVYSQSLFLAGIVHLGAPTSISSLHSADLLSTHSLLSLLGVSLTVGGIIIGVGFPCLDWRKRATATNVPEVAL